MTIILAVILGLLIASELVVNPLLNFIVKPKLIENANDKKYHLNIKSLGYSLLTNSLTAANIFYTWNDTSAGSTDSSVILIPESRAKGISLFGLLFGSRLSLLELQLIEPEYKIFTLRQKENLKNSPSEKNNARVTPIYRSIYRSIPDRIKPFKIGKVEITGGSYKKIDKEKNVLLHSFGSIDAGIKDFSIQSLEKNDSLKLMFCQEILLNFRGIHLFYPEKKYNLFINSAELSSADSVLSLNSFSFNSLLPDSEFFNGDSYREDRWKVSVPQIKCEGINFSNFIWYNAADINFIHLKGEYIDILTNMRKEIIPGFDPEMPNEIMKRINLGLNIRHINLNIDSVIVREFWPYSSFPSRLPFTKVKGDIINLSNLKELQSYSSPSVIKASALLAGAGLISMDMKIPLLADGTDVQYSGSLTGMNAAALNTHLFISDLVKVSSGIIDSVSFKAEATNGIVSAVVIPYYRDLKIKTINKESMDSGGLITSIQTFIANVFKIKNDNPDASGKLRIGREIYTEVKTDTFLDIVWTSLKKALGKAVGF